MLRAHNGVFFFSFVIESEPIHPAWVVILCGLRLKGGNSVSIREQTIVGYPSLKKRDQGMWVCYTCSSVHAMRGRFRSPFSLKVLVWVTVL